MDGAAEGPAVETAVVLDVAAGFEPAQGFGDWFVAVARCFLELARGEAAAGEEQDPEDAGSGTFEIANEVALFFEGHERLRFGMSDVGFGMCRRDDGDLQGGCRIIFEDPFW